MGRLTREQLLRRNLEQLHWPTAKPADSVLERLWENCENYAGEAWDWNSQIKPLIIGQYEFLAGLIKSPPPA